MSTTTTTLKLEWVGSDSSIALLDNINSSVCIQRLLIQPYSTDFVSFFLYKSGQPDLSLAALYLLWTRAFSDVEVSSYNCADVPVE